MSPEEAATERPGGVEDDIARLVDEAVQRFRDQQLSGSSVVNVLGLALAMLGRVKDYDTLRERVGGYLKDAETWELVLTDLLAGIQAMEANRAKRERFEEPWWSRKLDEISGALQRDSDAGADLWLQTFAEGLVAGRLDACNRLLGEPLALPEERVSYPLLRQGVTALAEGRFADAIPVVSFLIEDGNAPSPAVDRPTRALLLTLRGRLNLRDGWDLGLARADLDSAIGLAPNLAPPYVGMGELHRSQGDPDGARELFQKAIDVEPGEPDGYVGMGLMAEDQEWWAEADTWYERGLRSTGPGPLPPVAFDRLLTPVTGNFYLKLAELTRLEPERALGALTRALELGIRPITEYAEMAAHRLRGDLLKDLGRHHEAAEAYLAAGRELVWKGDTERAIEVLRLAGNEDPSIAAVSWFLADALLQRSYSGPPPYFVQTLHDEALTEWQGRAAGELPDPEHSWAYISRAIMNEQLLKVRPGEEWALSWEALAYSERSVLLHPTYAWGWAYLGRSYRASALGKQMAALQATGKALEHDPYNAEILQERAAALDNVGEYDAAEETIDRRLQLGPEPWASYVKAYARLGKGDAARALSIIDQVIVDTGGEEGTDFVYLEFRAMCSVRMGDLEAAARDYEMIWRQRAEPRVQGVGADTMAWAAFAAGDMQAAIEISRKSLQDRTEGASQSHQRLGLFLVAQGNIGEGKRLLEQGISLEELPADLTALIDQDIPYVAAVAAQRGHPQAETVLKELKAKASKRAGQIQVPTPEEELGEVLADLEGGGETGGWDLVGATAGMARLHTEAMRWGKAADAYRLLLACGDRFPEAAKGLAQVALGMQVDGDATARDGNVSSARDTYRTALSLVIESRLDEPATIEGLRARIALMDFELGDHAEGKRGLMEAIGAPGAEPGAGSRMGAVGASLVWDAAHYWTLDDRIREIQEEATSPDVAGELTALRAGLATVPATLFQLSPLPGEATVQPPEIQEIALEIGAELQGEGEWAGWPMFTTYIPEMRDRLQREMGVRTPGIRVRGSDVLGAGDYIIKLHEATVAAGSTEFGMSYTPAPIAALRRAGVESNARVEAPDPASGRGGWWIDADAADQARSEGIEVWPDPPAFAIRHVEAVLRTHLGHYLGPDNMRSWAENWDAASPVAPGPVPSEQMAAALLEDGASVVRLSHVLRALVNEMVPVSDLGSIAETLGATGVADEGPGLVAKLRQALKEQLPSNRPGSRLVWLPEALEAEMQSWLSIADPGSTTLAVPADRLAAVIGALVELAGDPVADPVIVTRDAMLRPHVRVLLAPALPTVPVLHADELIERSMESGPDADVQHAVAVPHVQQVAPAEQVPVQEEGR